MPDPFELRIEILPPAQREIWPQLAPASDLLKGLLLAE
jgi:hypothetical protein